MTTPVAAPTDAPPNNVPEFTVAQISSALQRTIEGAFSRVRVRGEVSGFKRAPSGHLYFTLKDTDAVLDACCWKQTAGRLALRPEDGMEVIVTGKLTTFGQRSKYQIIVDAIELAGKGALLALIEARKKALAAEGLFDPAHKKKIPFLPEVIGVVTSPTGAVIRDILHRLADRFPRRVLVWPVLVQGPTAAAQVSAAINGFNALGPGGAVPRPDLIIVARGGGSIEDLMAFNEEAVVRAAAASAIPLISAVGHETDTTLIDFASSRRAPTPTAAAELAVPVRAELLQRLFDHARRLVGGLDRTLGERRLHVRGLARGLGDPQGLVQNAGQRLDDRIERLGAAMRGLMRHHARDLDALRARLPHPRTQLRVLAHQLAGIAGRLRKEPLQDEVTRHRDALARFEARLARDGALAIDQRRQRLDALTRVLETLSYKNTLARGYAAVREARGRAVLTAGETAAGQALELEFRDGRLGVAVTSKGKPAKPASDKD
ncbi:MAG: exodeoxyribonuclease VII large subunit, partial [Alphaproteobacteria bacterium]|nr:exodeoxyribonuclease VII large subunit [Alphaproteobacteria bacterium]